MNRNTDALREILEKIVATLETIGNQTSALTASGDPVQAVHEPPGAASIAGNIRSEIRELQILFEEKRKDL